MPVCHSVHFLSGPMFLPGGGGLHPGGCLHPEGGGRFPWNCDLMAVTKAGGAHRTGMHSCLINSRSSEVKP